MARRSYRASDASSDEININLTPLIDVVFVVLIIFIIIAPMVELDRIELAESAGGARKEALNPSETNTISIYVRKDNTIWLNGMQVELKQLTLLLKEMHRVSPTKKPKLFQDKQAFFGTYQTVKNAVEGAGFDELDVVLKPG